MRLPRLLVALAVVIGTAPTIALAPGGVAVASDAGPQTTASVDPAVGAQVASRGEATFWLILGEKADLTPAYDIADWDARGRFVYDRLTETAASSQADLIADLRARDVPFESFWILNSLRVTGDAGDLSYLARRSEVAKIRADEVFSIPEPEPSSAGSSPDAVEWGVAAIHAPEVWAAYATTGEGIVVANIDTGVEFDHPALSASYRGSLGGGSFDHDYSWFDPTGICGTTPCDNNSHGTHTMGTMVGDDGAGNAIGVAPGATWIAAKGCGTWSCTGADLLGSGQWMLAPTATDGSDPRPELRPHVVNNSWGSSGGFDWYRATVLAWEAAGIFPVFSNGNSGPGCDTVGSPGDNVESYAVGAFDSSGRIAGFSSRGASSFGAIKPNISAPGVFVRSSTPYSSYSNMSGTSMAAPHVAGALALLWSLAPALVGDVATTRSLFDGGATDVSDTTCGGTAGDNNVWGEGKLDILATADLAPTGPTGRISGTVVDAGTGAPVVGASVIATGPDTRTAVTTGGGIYVLGALSVGTYDVAFSAFGYEERTVEEAVVSSGSTTTVDTTLAAIPRHALGGTVYDDAGSPVAGATVTIVGSPLSSSTTEASGRYSFGSVPEGTHDIAVGAAKCISSAARSVTLTGEVVDADMVAAARLDAFGHHCSQPAPAYVEADEVLSLSGDEGSVQVDLPFDVALYGTTYGTAWVCTNGFVTFDGSSCDWNNRSIPSTGVPNAGVYPFWDDLYVDDSASVRTTTLEGPDRFVIEWRNIRPYGDTSRRWDVEVVFFASGEILFQYRNLAADDRERGASATIGIEGPSGVDALEFGSNTVVFGQPEAAILFHPPSDAPFAVADAYETDTASVLSVVAPGVLGNDSDGDGDTLVASITADATLGSVELGGDGGFVYTPGGSGVDTFRYQACDPGGACAEATVTVLVGAANVAPVAVSDAYSTDAVGVLSVGAPGVLGNDSDGNGNALFASLASEPSLGSVVIDDDGAFVYTPGLSGIDIFRYRACDSGGACADASITVTVAPVISLLGANPALVATGEPWVDPGVAVTGLGPDGSLITDDPVVTDTPGSFTVTYTATDGAGNVAVAARAVTVAYFCDGLQATIWGGPGDDLLRGTSGPDVIHGGPGDDLIQGRAGDDVACGGEGNDRLEGGTGIDTLSGGPGDDSLAGGDGGDTLGGGAGDDSFEDVSGTNAVDGGLGRDSVDFSAAPSGVTIDTRLGVLGGGAAGTITGVENVTGSQHADTITTGGEANRIDGGAGDDTIYAGSGADVVRGGDGDDLIRTQGGADIAQGGDGDDRLVGGGGGDRLMGNTGDDTLQGGSGDDILRGHRGIDMLRGDSGDDILQGHGSSDHLRGGAGADDLRGGGGADVLWGGGGADTLEGHRGNDVLIGGPGADSADGGSGADKCAAEVMVACSRPVGQWRPARKA